MSLKKLLNHSLYSEFLLIHDHKDAKGEFLLNEFIKQNVSLNNDIHVLCLENIPEVAKALENASNVTCYYIYDQEGWLNENKEDSSSSNNNICTILNKIHSNLKPGVKTIVIINTLSLFDLFWPDECYKTVHKFIHCKGKGPTQLICLIHEDVLPNKKSLLMFEQLAKTNIIVRKEGKQYQITTKHRKDSGRIIQSVEQVIVNQSGDLIIEDISKKDVSKSQEADDKSDWLNNEITFKLDLKEEEKHARSNLSLPYVKTSTSTGTGEIQYVPDERDDWDEEDPDDDLNI